MKKRDIPIESGTLVINVIAAMKGGICEQILEEFAHPKNNPLKHRREFGNWISNVCQGAVLRSSGELANLTLVRYGTRKEFDWFMRGEERVLVIEEVVGERCEFKPMNRDGFLTIQIGRLVLPSRIPSLANQISAMYLDHGNGWKDRAGQTFQSPHGHDPSRRKKKNREGSRRGRRQSSRQ